MPDDINALDELFCFQCGKYMERMPAQFANPKIDNRWYGCKECNTTLHFVFFNDGKFKEMKPGTFTYKEYKERKGGKKSASDDAPTAGKRTAIFQKNTDSFSVILPTTDFGTTMYLFFYARARKIITHKTGMDIIPHEKTIEINFTNAEEHEDAIFDLLVAFCGEQDLEFKKSEGKAAQDG